jgi:serine/threonine protein kinase
MRSVDWLCDLSKGWKIEAKRFASGTYGDIFTGIQIDSQGKQVGEEVCVKRMDPTTQRNASGTGRSPVGSEDRHRNILNFFREVFMQVSSENPAVLPIRGWNIINEKARPEFILVSNRMKEPLEIPSKGKLELSNTEKTIILYGIARGMAYLHSLRVLHRDLKPENVFLDQRRYPCIADLGLAKVATTEQQSVRCGTPIYLAPEVWNSTNYSFPADVYSFAMVLYAIVEEQIPIAAGVKDGNALAQMANSALRPTCRVIKSHLKRMLEKMWNKQSGKRPPFTKIAHTLERRKYHLPDTDRSQFSKYKRYLDEQEQLIQSKYVRRVAPWLNDLHEKANLTPEDLSVISRLRGLGDYSAQLVTGLLIWNGNVGPSSIFEAARVFSDNCHLFYISFLMKLLAEGTTLQQGVISELSGDTNAAGEAYKKAAGEGVPEAIVRYGSLLLASGKEKPGVAILAAIAEKGNLNAICTLADFYYRWKNNSDKALDYFSRAAKKDVNPWNSAPYFMTAKLLVEKGKKDEAVPYIKAVAEIDGENAKWAQIAKQWITHGKRK